MSAGHQESETVSAAEESRAGEASADQRRPEFKEQLLQRADRLLQSVHQDLHGQPGQQGQVSDLHCLLVVTAVMSCTAAGDTAKLKFVTYMLVKLCVCQCKPQYHIWNILHLNVQRKWASDVTWKCHILYPFPPQTSLQLTSDLCQNQK